MPLAQSFLGVAGGDPSHGVTDALHVVPGVSVTMQCVMFLLVQYFVIYTLLAVVRSYNQIAGNGKTRAQAILSASTATAAFAPMMAVLFLAARMRAVQLSGGKKGDPPHAGVVGMLLGSWGLLLTTTMALIVPCATGAAPSETGDAPKAPEGTNKWVGYILEAIRYTLLVCVYGGVIAVVYAIFTTEADPKIFKDGPPPVAPAVAATMWLTSLYFIVYTLLCITKTVNDLRGQEAGTWQTIFEVAACTVAFCPMLAILFIGARMRALQIDPVNGAPQRWAQLCFFACAYAVLLQAISVIVTPLFGVKAKKGELEGDVGFEYDPEQMMQKVGYYLCTAVRYFALFALYGCSTAVIVSVWTIEAKTGPTPPVSPAMQCVIGLTCQFFFIYLALFLAVTYRDVMGASEMLTTVQTTMEIARSTVQYAPALAVLFIGVRMRALQVTDNKCGPPLFAQNCMFLATYQLAIQLMMVLVFPYAARVKSIETDEEGNPTKGGVESPKVATATEVMRYSSQVVMYVGIVSCCYSLFTVTEDTANCGAPEEHKLMFFSVQGPSLWVLVLNGVMGLVPVGMVLTRCCNLI